VVFLAELGDKSQLLAVTLATRLRASVVLIGITAAALATHGLSVALGQLVAEELPERPISILAGLTFLGFAVWTIRDVREDDEEDGDDDGAAAVGGVEQRAVGRGAAGAAMAVAVAFFLSELADKTMLASIALSARQGALATWIGATAGMVAADAIAVVAGRQLGVRLPERVLRVGSAVTFVVFGILLLADGIVG
jgi:putative Ca2+/H+ antiporter (TMEM165/GDT1 family)